MSDSLQPMDCNQPGSSVHGNFPGKNTGVDGHALLQGLFPAQGWNLGLPYCNRSPVLQADSLPSELPAKPKNTGLGSLSLLQGNLPDPGIELASPAFQADSLPTELPGKLVRLNAAAAKSLQSCPTLCDPVDSSPPGSPVPGILQVRTLEWVAISFSNA